MNQLYILYGISILSIVFGFVALLKQKTYVDTKTKQPTEIEIPIFGKLKTNYPSLVFLFVGFLLAYFTFDKSFPPKQVEWTIKGSFKKPADRTIQWEEGTFKLIPCAWEPDISNRGDYEISLKIDEGVSFEDYIEMIDYSHPLGNAQIFPIDEYSSWVNEDTASLIINATKSTRMYKPLPIQLAHVEGGLSDEP